MKVARSQLVAFGGLSSFVIMISACETDDPPVSMNNMEPQEMGSMSEMGSGDLDMPRDMTPDMVVGPPDMNPVDMMDPPEMMEPDLPPPDPCEGIDCGANGMCVPMAQQPSCACSSGYEPMGLRCVLEPTAPTLDNLPAREVGELGQPDSFQLMASDPNEDETLSYSVADNACAFDVTVGPMDGLVSWTCPLVSAECEVTIAVTDKGGLVTEGALTIECANGVPIFTSTPPTQGAEYAELRYTVACEDPDGLPVTLSVAPDDTCGGMLQGDDYVLVPGEEMGGTTCLLKVLCSDGEATESQSSMVAIQEVNQPPVINNLPAMSSARWGRMGTFAVQVSDPDLPAQQLVVSLINRTCSFHVNVAANGAVSYTCGNAVETCSATVSVSDGSLSAQGTLTISCTNAAPAFMGAPATMASEHQLYSYTPSCTDTDGDQVMISLTSNTCGGNFTGGAFSFTPNESQGGTSCAIAFACTDGLELVTQSATIMIQEVNRPPVITNLPQTVSALWGRSGAYTITATDPDLPVQTITFSRTSTTCSFPVNVAANGTTSFTCGNAVETCSAVIAANDGVASSSATLNISCTNTPPTVSNVAISPNPIPQAGTQLTCNYTFNDADGDSNQSTVQWLVNGSVAGTGATFSNYQPNNTVACRVTPFDGVSTGTQVTSPTLTAPPPPIPAGGSSHTCAVHKGAAYCWGAGSSGQLGNNTTNSSNIPVQVQGLTSGVTFIAAGSSFSCAIHNGAAKCWGEGGSGQLGNNTTTSSNVPVQVQGLTSGVTAISLGAGFACAIHNGAAKCWGTNFSGQLGNNTTTSSNVPVQVQGLTSNVTFIELGDNHACAIQSGAARCWGSNGSGRLGNGTTTDSSVPVQVTGLTSGVTTLSGGWMHSCAVQNGAARCWGTNSLGRLGDPAFTDSFSNVPRLVPGLASGTTGVAAGDFHTCVIHNNAAKCWGSNSSGQLGDGTNNNATAPVQVQGLTSNTSSITTGWSHSCAVQSGVLKCWGSGSSGQLGNNAAGTTNSPVDPQLP